MLDPTRHVLLKLILHSNLPGQDGFGKTARCRWTIVGRREASDDDQRILAQCDQNFDSIAGAIDRIKTRDGCGTTTMDGGVSRRSSPDDDDDDDVARSGTSKLAPREQPMILDRTANDQDTTVKGRLTGKFVSLCVCLWRRGISINLTSRFGANGNRATDLSSRGFYSTRDTEIHGFPGIAFEVTQSRHVETVWLF